MIPGRGSRWLAALAATVILAGAGALVGSRRAAGQIIGGGSIKIVQVQSQYGGTETISGQPATSHRHGGPSMALSLLTKEKGTVGGTRATFAGWDASNTCGSYRLPDGSLVRCWIIPEQAKGNSGYFYITDGGDAIASIFIYGSRSCVGICGSQPPECPCSFCNFFQCCSDKVAACGGS